MADVLAVCDECESVYAAYRGDDGEIYLRGTGKRCFECGGTALRELTAENVGPGTGVRGEREGRRGGDE